ncbi:MAG: hemolysin-III related-domain-containing protein [Piptocephalis tieghemiana]|nr:MAG: hemolysin-III related-domain-containing protein [Piptocephalis tieghemiana]
MEAGSRRLLHFEELPVEWQENEHILTGYRFLSSYTQCLHSIFQVHNETGNIWTHLIGALFFLGLAVYHHRHLLPSLDASLLDHTIFLIFFAAVAKCLLCSVMYHTFTCHSHLPTMKCAATLDYMGISLLITASLLVTEYYGFYCMDGPRNAYMLATAVMGLVGSILPWFPWFDEREYRGVRVSVFLLMGAAGIFPIFHAGLTRGLIPTLNFLYPLAFSILAYISGVYFFVQKFPERRFPGWFDHLGNSHQLWHIFVVAGIWGHYVASNHFFTQRFTYGCLA